MFDSRRRYGNNHTSATQTDTANNINSNFLHYYRMTRFTHYLGP